MDNFFIHVRDAVRSMVVLQKGLLVGKADIGKHTFGLYCIIMVIQVIQYTGPF